MYNFRVVFGSIYQFSLYLAVLNVQFATPRSVLRRQGIGSEHVSTYLGSDAVLRSFYGHSACSNDLEKGKEEGYERVRRDRTRSTLEQIPPDAFF